jgi:hypothetical protein
MTTLTVRITDWSRSLPGTEFLDIPSDVTVGEILDEATEAMSLPNQNYHALYEGEKLNRSATLEEIGIESGEELTIAPDVSAGGCSWR